MSYCYVIDMGRSGGEVTLHPFDRAFAEYWAEHSDWELTEHVENGFESDKQSPPVSAEDPEDWQALPQLASVYGATDDSALTVHETTLNGDASIVDGEFTPDPSLGFFRSFLRGKCAKELKLTDAEVKVDRSQRLHQSPTKEANQPVMSVRTLEDGPFACAFLRSDQPFDPENLKVAFIGTNFQQVVNGIWYDGAPLELDSSDDISEMTGIHCDVGYIDPDEPPLGRTE